MWNLFCRQSMNVQNINDNNNNNNNDDSCQKFPGNIFFAGFN